MNKNVLTLILGALAFAGCAKVGVVETKEPKAVSVRTVVSNPTRSAELAGTALPAGTAIYMAATHRDMVSDVVGPNFLSKDADGTSGYYLFGNYNVEAAAGGGALFRREASGLFSGAHANIYYPLNGKLDFLACAMVNYRDGGPGPYAKKDEAGYWPSARFITAGDSSSGLVADDVCTDIGICDFLWATSNGNHADGNDVVLHFRHAQALLIFNIKFLSTSTRTVIDDIVFWDQSAVQKAADRQPVDSVAATIIGNTGTFVLDNTKNEPGADWKNVRYERHANAIAATSSHNGSMHKHTNSPLADSGISPANLSGIAMRLPYSWDAANPAFTSADVDITKKYQLGETILVPQQERQNFTVFYHYDDEKEPRVTGAPLRCTHHYTYNTPRGWWEMGYKYIYEIEVPESGYINVRVYVEPWEYTDTIIRRS